MPKLTKSVVDKSPTRESQYTVWCSELKGFGDSRRGASTAGEGRS
jgi:hypothetical protein